jgi:hypothetical protein
MDDGTGIKIDAFGEFSPDRTFVVHLQFEGPSKLIKKLLKMGFPYTLRFESNMERMTLSLNEDFEGNLMWNTGDEREIIEILGCVIEREGYEEKYNINTELQSYSYKDFKKVPKYTIRKFKNALLDMIYN